MGKISEPYTLEFRLFFGDENTAKIVFASVEPDLKSRHETRSKTDIKLKKDMLSVNIVAKDPTALRASFNSYFKSIALAKTLTEVI